LETLIVLIPALPLAGFLFAVLAGARLDRIPLVTHGHGGHDHNEQESDHEAGHAVHASVDESGFRPIPSEEEQAATSPHAGHADDLANAEGADGVIPPELADGIGQASHAGHGADRPVYRSWIVPTAMVGIGWVLSMIVFASVIFGGNTYHVSLYEWIAAGAFHVQIGFSIDALAAMLLLVVSTVGFLVHVYSIGYMDGDRGMWRFFAYLNLFMFSMLLLIFADNYLLLYVGWELVVLCS
jgi:cytochrome b561